ncbi:MAG: hypothetical protein AAGU14_12320, partial [Eubacteriaceae bacterium]
GAYMEYMESADFSESHSDYHGSLTHPHSFFILLSAETGYLATMAYTLTLLILLLMLAITWFRCVKDRNNSYRLNTLIIILFLGFIVTSYIAENSFYDTQISPLFFIMVGLSINYINKSGYAIIKKGNRNG